MTALDRVRNFIVEHPKIAACDTCIAKSVGLSTREHANNRTRELVKCSAFHRHTGRCGICGKIRQIVTTNGH